MIAPSFCFGVNDDSLPSCHQYSSVCQRDGFIIMVLIHRAIGKDGHKRLDVVQHCAIILLHFYECTRGKVFYI